MNRCEYCGEPYRPGIGCTNPQCPQRFVFYLRCDCGAPMYERSNGADPNKRTYYCSDCKTYVFMTLNEELESFYCSENGCVYKGKPAKYGYIEPLRTHSFSCPGCDKDYRIRKIDLRQWVGLLETV